MPNNINFLTVIIVWISLNSAVQSHLKSEFEATFQIAQSKYTRKHTKITNYAHWCKIILPFIKYHQIPSNIIRYSFVCVDLAFLKSLNYDWLNDCFENKKKESKVYKMGTSKRRRLKCCYNVLYLACLSAKLVFITFTWLTNCSKVHWDHWYLFFPQFLSFCLSLVLFIT